MHGFINALYPVLINRNEGFVVKRRAISCILAVFFAANIAYTSNVYASDSTAGQADLSRVTDTTATTKEKIMTSFKNNKGKRNYKKDEVLVKVINKEETDYNSWLEKTYPIKIKRNLSNGLTVVTFDNSVYSVEQILNKLNKDLNIEYAEPNYSTKVRGIPSNEPYYKNLWAMKNSLYPGIDINIETAWNAKKSNETTVVAVIDTGIDYNHVDLNKNLWINEGEVLGNGIDDDNNGYVDDYRGWNFVEGNNNPYDDNEHGTHVSGVIAGVDNGTGIVGVSPTTKIMALKVGDAEGNLYNDDIIEAINYGIKKGVKVFNCSFSGGEFSQVEYEIIKKSKALFVVAAGNEAMNNDTYNSYPANYELPNIISVGAINKQGSLAYFSNYGVKNVDIAAPGEGIFSTLPNNAYGYYDGTSMAAPYVSAVAALALSEKPELTPEQIRAYILENNHPISNLSKTIATGAMLDAGKVIEKLSQETVPVEKPVDEPVVKENGWINKDNKWYFYKDGQPQLNWQSIDGHWYYFNKEGIRQTGWQYLNSKWYYLNENGVMATGWKFLNGKWYFLEASGAMATGWRFDGGRWYYLAQQGQMLTAWQYINGKWYYLEPSGAMATGWKYLGSQWYYLENSGEMAIGWRLVGGKWYYLYSSGAMAANTSIGIYKLGASGALIN